MSTKLPVSERIRNRILEANRPFLSTDNISKYILEDEKGLLVDEVTEKFQSVLESLIIDTVNDHNTKDTARRVAKMYVNEIFSGRFNSAPAITTFPNAKTYDQLYVTGPITVRSVCAHHFQNISGVAYIGVYPGKNVMGLSKFNRIVDWYASRPSIQEELTVQIANHVQEITQADGVAVVIKAEHGCMTARGVKEHESDMTTSHVHGTLRENQILKQEFFNILSGMKGWQK